MEATRGESASMSDSTGTKTSPVKDDADANGTGNKVRVDCYSRATGRYKFVQSGTMQANGEAESYIRGSLEFAITVTPTSGGGGPSTPGGEGGEGPITFTGRANAPVDSGEPGNPDDGKMRGTASSPSITLGGKPTVLKQITLDPDDYDHTQSDGVEWEAETSAVPPSPTTIASVKGGQSTGTVVLDNVTVISSFTGQGEELGFFVQEPPGGMTRGIFVSAAGMGVPLGEGDVVTLMGLVETVGGRTQLFID